MTSQDAGEIMENSANGRLASIDALRAVCAFLVICIHAPFPGTVGAVIKHLANIAVPIFLIISGYFYKREKAGAQARKLMKMFFVWNIFYFVFSLAAEALSGGDPLSVALDSITIEHLFTLLLLNVPIIGGPTGGHLWFLAGEAYALVAISWMEDRGLGKYEPAVCIVLLMLSFVLGIYAPFFFGNPMHGIYTRNWLYTGIPCMLAGLLIRRSRDRLSSVPTGALSCAVALLSAACVGEYFLLEGKVPFVNGQFASAIALAVALFCLCLRVDAGNGVLASIGREHSTRIYIVHPSIVPILGALAGSCGIAAIYGTVAPIAVFSVSLAVSALVSYAGRRFLRE
jgi:surface polysaccharide O-acyltransferase-like enzyme